MIRFIDEHKDRRSGELRWGIEPIAKTVGIAPSTYYAAKARPPSPWSVRDDELNILILACWESNLAVYGDEHADASTSAVNRKCPLTTTRTTTPGFTLSDRNGRRAECITRS